MQISKLPEWVKIGRNHRLDHGVKLGYATDRSIGSVALVIGENTRVRSGTIIYAGSRIGDNLETGHNVVIREENIIGNNFTIWSNSVIDYGCKVGNDVKVHANCYIAQFTVLEDEVFLAPGTMIANDIHPGCEFSKDCMRGPVIKKGAQLGINCTILPFVIIGERAVVGAGSVVTKDIPPESVAYGNPARVVGSIYDLKCVTGLTDKPYKKGRSR